MISPTQLAAIREREQKATPGPWTSDGAYVHATMKCPGEGECPFEDCELDEPEHEFVIATCEQDYEADRAIDGPFIAHARTDIPALLVALEEQARELETRDRCAATFLAQRDALAARCERLRVSLQDLDDADEIGCMGESACALYALCVCCRARAALAGGEEG